MNVSKSPDRLTFQKEKYLKRCESEGLPPSSEYLKMYDEDLKRYDCRFADPKSRINNLEYDLLTTDWILEKVRHSESYAQNLYAAICNTDFVKNDVWPILTETKWSCSWRYAGGIVADMRQQGDYIDWYCSGIKNMLTDDELKKLNKKQLERYEITKQFVGEGYVTEEIREDLYKLGWIVIDDSQSV